MSDAKTKSRRERAEEIKKQAAAAQRRRALAVYGVIAVVALALIALAAVAIRDASEANDPAKKLKTGSGLGSTSAPPWPLPTGVPDRVELAGLDLGPMGTADHYHAHLDILADGKPVALPNGVGIDPDTGQMSAVHTHTADGIIHVEAETKGQPFTLGQLFTQWDVRLSPDQMGSLRTGDGKALRAYVDGKQVNGNPAMIRLADRRQIALVFGPADSNVKPPTFKFPKDL